MSACVNMAANAAQGGQQERHSEGNGKSSENTINLVSFSCDYFECLKPEGPYFVSIFSLVKIYSLIVLYVLKQIALSCAS